MPKEIERKFKVISFDPEVLKEGKKEKIIQGYLSFNPEIRVRVKGEKAFLTIKSEGAMVRDEFEYQIPIEDGQTLLSVCPFKVEKTRYTVGRWEIDIFEGKLQGLVLAEVELRDEREEVEPPAGFEMIEVTEDKRYKNKNLAKLESIKDLNN